MLTTDPGGFENLLGSTLSGGTYSVANAGGALDFNVGGLIVTDAATINLGSLASDVIASFDVNTGSSPAPVDLADHRSGGRPVTGGR